MSKQNDHSHLLAINVGNTNILIGVHDGNHWSHHWRVQTVRERMPDEYAVLLHNFLSGAGLEFQSLQRSVLSSVVPPLTRGLTEMVLHRTGCRPLVINWELNLGIRINTDQPQHVGHDLIANAVAGYERFQSNCIVVDFGTATTLTAVKTPGEMIGVVIAAGLHGTADALVHRTAQLPHVELIPPPSIIGRNTIHAMQAGLVTGHIVMVEGLVDRMRQEMGGASVIATGGLSSLFGPLTGCFDVVDPWLTLEGLRLIAGRNP